MAIATMEVTGIDEIITMFERGGEVVEQEVAKTMRISLDTFKQAVQLEWPVNFGTGRASTTTEIEGTSVDLTGFVLTPLIYGRPVEDGRTAGTMPPVEAIEIWVIRKLGISPPESHGVAFMIARSIGRKGTKGAKMFQKGFDNALPLVEAQWDQLLDNIFTRL